LHKHGDSKEESPGEKAGGKKSAGRKQGSGDA
jgi:hypothetical protein